MSKKVHIGNGGTPSCARGMSAHRTTCVHPSITKTREEFFKLPREEQCERCLKNNDTSHFAAGLAEFIGLK